MNRTDSLVVHDLSPDAVATMLRVDLSTVEEEPPSPIGHFQFNGCTCRVASFVGRPPWELLVIVPRGCWHNNDAPNGVTMLFMTPSEGNSHSWDDPE
jgi:hypothetical protein